MAGLDGIKNRIDPGEPMDKNLYDLPPEEQANIKEVPSSLEEAINNLEKDNIELNEQIEMYKSNNFKDLFYDTKIILIVWVAIIAILCQLLIYLLHIQ